jgi:hypothetical protein
MLGHKVWTSRTVEDIKDEAIRLTGTVDFIGKISA